MKTASRTLVTVTVLAAGGILAGCASTREETAQTTPPLVQVEEQKEDQNVRQWREKAAMAIQAARAAVKQAASLDALRPETDQLMERAQRAYDNKDYENAVAYAGQAKQQAEDSINQAYLTRARTLLDQIKATKPQLTPEQESLLNATEAAYANREGKRSFDMASTLAAQLEAAKVAKAAQPAASVDQKGKSSTYQVARGDTLWDISGKSQIYGNPYQWPLIYKANRDQIKDADLIHPRQVLKIDREASKAQIDAAVRHAKTRGAWSLGVTEESDKAYLAR